VRSARRWASVMVEGGVRLRGPDVRLFSRRRTSQSRRESTDDPRYSGGTSREARAADDPIVDTQVDGLAALCEPGHPNLHAGKTASDANMHLRLMLVSSVERPCRPLRVVKG